MVPGLRTTTGNPASPPYALGPYTWDQDMTFTGNLTVLGTFTFGDAATDALQVNGTLNVGTVGDAAGIALTDSSLKAVEIAPELFAAGDALGAGVVAYGIRNRFLINKAQVNNVSLYATQGQLRVKANMAAGVHAGLYGYFEQSGTVTLSSSGSFNTACNLAVEGAATLTVDAGVNLAGAVITSALNSGGTYNGNLIGLMIRKQVSAQDWAVGIEITSAEQGITFGNYGGTVSVSGLFMGWGTSGDPATTSTADAKFVEFRCQSTSATGDNRLMYMRYDLNGGGGGECLRAFTKVTASTGTARGAHLSLDVSTDGAISGLGIGMDGQLLLPGEAVNTGTWAAVQAEVYTVASTTVGSATMSLFRANVGGDSTAINDFDDNGNFLDLSGMLEGDGNIVSMGTGGGAPTIAGTIRIIHNGTERWIALASKAAID